MCVSVYMYKGEYDHRLLPPASLNHFALEQSHVVNPLYNLPKINKITGMKEKGLGKFFRTIYVPCSWDG